jgi:hypothetical protein
VVTPQLREEPALREAKMWPPETANGTLLAVFVPSPIWPKSLPPQQ